MKRIRDGSATHISTPEAALHKSNSPAIQADLYRILFTASPLPAWIYDEESTVITAVNRAAIREFGYQEMEFILMTRAMICPEKTRSKSLLDEINADTISGYIRKDGSRLTAKSQEHSLLFKGRPSRLCVLEPTSRQPQVPEDLRLLASALAEASVAVMVTDSGSDATGPNIVFVNAGFGQLTGYSADEVIGRPLAFIQPPHTECLSTAPGDRISDHFGAFTYQTAALDRSGLKYSAECHVTPLRDESGNVTHYLNLQRDVTERNRLQDQLRQAEKMEAVGRLGGGIAHDFNNLLTIILGYCGLLTLEVKNPKSKEKCIRNLGEIQKAAEKAAVLTSQLLAFSRKQVFHPSVIVLNTIITNMEGMLRRLIGEDVDLHIVIDPDLGTVFTDSGQVEQVLMNLAVNARDAMPRGGTLVIETGNVEITPHHAPATGIEPGLYVRLTMTDSGIGMDDETRARIFEPFFTTKEPGRGTGLGLSMTYGFVKQSGGVIKLYSEPGCGASFQIYLPRADSKLELVDASVSVEAPQGNGVVLVVEDDMAIRELVREMLAGGGYEVFTAANGQEAIDFVKVHPEPLDLLLTDVVLPGTSGPDLAAKLRAFQSGLRVLFASGYSDHALVRQGMLESGDAFVQKPFNASALLRIVSDMLNSKVLSVRA